MDCYDGNEKSVPYERFLMNNIMEKCLKGKYKHEDNASFFSDYDWNNYDLSDENEKAYFVNRSIDNVISKNTVAVKYLSKSGDFLYAEAIKDHFELPCSLPEEKENREIEFYDIIRKIAIRDVPLSFEVWEWCLEEFLPYKEYDFCCSRNLFEDVLYYFYNYPDNYMKDFVHYLSRNEKFCNSLMISCDKYVSSMNDIIYEALKEELFDIADVLFKFELEKSKDDWKTIYLIIDSMIFRCQLCKNLEPMEYFRDKYIPLIKEIPNELVQDKLWEVQPEIQKFIDEVESNNPKYAYTRRNSWRNNVSEEEIALENPLYYNSEDEYRQAVYEKKYRWRKICMCNNTYGLDPENYETFEEYDAARSALQKEQAKAYRLQREQEFEQKRKREKEEKTHNKNKVDAMKEDTRVYIYCGVLLPNADKPYWFITDDETIEVRDTVIVPVGKNCREIEAKVVSVGGYLRIAAPYPVEETKKILRKVQS